MPNIEALTPIAVARRDSLGYRALVAIFLMTAALSIKAGWMPFAWFAAILVSLVIDWMVCKAILARTSDLKPAPYAALTLWTVASIALYSSISLYFWAFGGDFGRSFALIQACGGMMQAAM